jgi:hypothetical protein
MIDAARYAMAVAPQVAHPERSLCLMRASRPLLGVLMVWTKCGSLRRARPRSCNSTRSKILERTTSGHDLSARGNVAKADKSGWSLYGA